MAFCTYSKEYTASSFTDVENVFIYAYLPEAEDNAVKVYLYGLYLCKKGEDYTLSDLSSALKITNEQAIDCFRYWEEFGLLDINSQEPFSVTYQPIGLSGAKPRKINVEKYTAFNNSVQKIISGRMISTNEYSEYFRLMEDFNIKPEAMLMIAQYCVDIKGDNIGYKYVCAVAKDFAMRGITTPEKVEKELENYITRSSEIAQILTALSQKRRPEIEDVKLFAKWTGELGFEPAAIVHAAATIKRGSINKLDEFIHELYANKRFSIKEITEFSKSKKYMYELSTKINKELSVYCEVLDPVVDNYTSKWLSYGFGEEGLLFIANYCFKRGRRSLESMNTTVENLYGRGVIDFYSIVDYFKQISKDDEFLKSILELTGQFRKPNEWDRQNLRQWRGWGFTDELINEAAGLAIGKSGPIVYINSILSSWKNKNAFTLDEVRRLNTQVQTSQKQSTVHFANERKYTREELDALITDVDDIDI